MRIVIIDDDATVAYMKRALVAAGHEVMAIGVCQPFGPSEVFDFETKDLNEVAAKTKEFNPERIFLDHDFGMSEDRTGATVAQLLDLPKEKLIGTSSSYDQTYCGQHFSGKDCVDSREYIRTGLLKLAQ